MQKSIVKLMLVICISLFTVACSERKTELVANGEFDLNTEGWEAYQGASLKINLGRLKVTNGNAGLRGRAIQIVATEIGQAYRFTLASHTGNAAAYYVYVTTNPTGSISGRLKGKTSHTVVEDSLQFVATTDMTTLVVGNNDAAADVYNLFDHISLTKVIE
jgi:hypothetical protein